MFDTETQSHYGTATEPSVNAGQHEFPEDSASPTANNQVELEIETAFQPVECFAIWKSRMPSPNDPSRPTPHPTQPQSDQTSVPAYTFDDLANGLKEVHILFEGQIYRLHKTRNDRLILTK